MATEATSDSIIERVRERLPDKSALSAEDVFSVLSHRRRRYTLYYLLQNGEDADLRDVSEQVAVWESDSVTATRDLGSAERKRVYTALQQNHLPNMDELGVIEYDRERGNIEPTEKLDELNIYLDIVQGGQLPWGGLYLALSLGNLLLLCIVWAVGYPFTVIPPLGWGTIVTAMFMLSSVAHLYENHHQKFSTMDAPPELDSEDE